MNGVLLDEFNMRHHPVTPMMDSSLVRLVDAQSNRKTGAVPHGVVEQGSTAVRAIGDRIGRGLDGRVEQPA